MKIDGNRPAHDSPATDGTRRTDRELDVRSGTGPIASGVSADRVELSGDAALRAAALKAAGDAPPIRADLVEQMREKLNAGQVGRDSLALADAIIDDLLP